MNDPWDVKSIKQSGQYTSFMKINGVPLLPPVLSKECRKEMQYYKLLAKEIEKRIKLLKPYLTESDTDGSDDKTDAPELPEYEQVNESPLDKVQEPYYKDDYKITSAPIENTIVKVEVDSQTSTLTSNVYNDMTSNILLMTPVDTSMLTSSPILETDLNLKNNDNDKLHIINELPERDSNCIKNEPVKELLFETELDETHTITKEKEIIEDFVTFSFNRNKDILNKSDPLPDLSQDGPASLSSKSFTGSLIDIPTEIEKESQNIPKLIRQRSYTVLKPSPQLLAHLEEQYLNTGVEITSISMSESLSSLCSPSKKRRSWDLESAKVKWSSMANELNQKTASSKKNSINKRQSHTSKATVKKVSPSETSQPNRTKSLIQDKSHHASVLVKATPISEPISRVKKTLSPVRNIPSNRTIVKEPSVKGTHYREMSPNNKKKETISPNYSQLISESHDPAARVRELYEKIQKQQLIQMANLVEKQKREQVLLQQVFEEQNNLLYKQLKTICPKSCDFKDTLEANSQDVTERGPVSLSQLINRKGADNNSYENSLSSTLTDTNNYISQCDNILTKSKDITGSIKKRTPLRSQNGSKVQSPNSHSETKTSNASTIHRHSTSRRLQYDSAGSTGKDMEPILSDRTNDTMADLNVSFPTDNDDVYLPFNNNNNTVIHQSKDNTLVHDNERTMQSSKRNLTDNAIRSIEESIYKSINNMALKRTQPMMFHCEPTPRERAAATTIVAYAKGYLVRRLLRTERVQVTIQTIKDALLCALQLHEDRQGIKRADIELRSRLLQQITSACYSLHDTFVTSTPAERAALVAADRARRRRAAEHKVYRDI